MLTPDQEKLKEAALALQKARHVKDKATFLRAAENYENWATTAAILAILAQLEQVQGWVSVKDRLPPNYREVMVWPHPTDYIMTAEVWGRSASGVPVWKYGEYQTGWGHEIIEMTSQPTHWREIPPPPEAA